ncbi:F-box domain-containing protein [Mycena sanguinolenta]|uniref:F-box domain-containing protein n=1 Tax=Mycena sanguinolenta TaxID=230812 RepID=A0A8H7CS84_9AGAR|nr:F-box domain-containing protein [Mycena sanguinolenta]
MSLANSPFTNRLNTNYVPSEPEVLEIRSLLVGPKEEIARIDAQIEEMELALVQLKDKRAWLQEPIDAYKALISPMRLVPQDILLEIFFACLPTKHNAVIDHNEAPLTSGPHLQALERISLFDFLNRQTPDLEISLQSPNLEKHPIILLLAGVARRLRSLGVAGDAELAKPLLQLGAEDVPLLKTIRLKTPTNQRPIMDILQISSLENLTLCISTPEDPLSLPLPWSQLTTLRFECYGRRTEHGRDGGLHFDGALNVLRRCPNLEYCEVRVSRSSQTLGLTPNSSSILLPRLHTLFLGGWHFRLEKWLSDLVVPNLRSLQIGDEPTGTAPPNQECLSLDIDLNRFTSTSIHELLQSFPMISHLQLSSKVFPPPEWLNDGFMALFGPPHNFCPVLTHITFLSPAAGFSDAATLAFIKARMAMATPLRRFQAQFNRPMESDIMPELKPFISDGLQVVRKYPPTPWSFRARDGLDGARSFF